eukprot:NODE_2642_length_889_cov_87.095238_g2175_i0.p1 GENE.NODE_2642_length_889_cov_87.095238_g2175_i0~~NODE_2642_length_889_cov_87.095238_g2175_i0.p1  ORF type:complete len:273 (+),score=85.68 NODE_2642_length_889_cov_87.095238_g2175_i0:34-819(+)
MKAAVATLLLALTAEASVTRPNSYSRKILANANYRHAHKYGQGGADYIIAHQHARAKLNEEMGRELTRIEKHRLYKKKDKKAEVEEIDGKKYYNVDGRQLDASKKSTELVAFFFELQFAQGSEFNSCTLCATELAETTEDMTSAFNNINLNTWFTATVYLGNHWLANFFALFEYCDLYQVLTPFSAMFPSDFADWTTYDISGISQTVSRFGTAGIAEAPKINKKMKKAKKEKDYMAVGMLQAEIFQLYFAISLDANSIQSD